MSADDPVDETALIFTEADVYMICGYLAERWGVGDDDHEAIAEDTEHAIEVVLSESPLGK